VVIDRIRQTRLPVTLLPLALIAFERLGPVRRQQRNQPRVLTGQRLRF
jgi:hypothetical protein